MSDSHIKWALDALNAAGFRIEDQSPETVQNTPWSNVYRFKTDKGYVYLKKVPPFLSIEPTVIQLLQTKFHDHVPVVIDVSHDHHCFLMKDSGIQLHEYFKTGFDAEILIKAIKEYSSIQISSMQNINDFLSVGVPDWRLDKLPKLYIDLIEREDILIEDGLSSAEIVQLRNKVSKLKEIFDRLSQYQINNAFGHADFHPKNILINTETLKTTIIDLGEVVITHPFFSLHNCLHMAKENFSLSTSEESLILNSCLEPWLALESRNNLDKILALIQQSWSIHAVLGEQRLMDSVNKEDFKKLHREGRLSKKLRFWINSKQVKL